MFKSPRGGPYKRGIEVGHTQWLASDVHPKGSWLSQPCIQLYFFCEHCQFQGDGEAVEEQVEVVPNSSAS